MQSSPTFEPILLVATRSDLNVRGGTGSTFTRLVMEDEEDDHRTISDDDSSRSARLSLVTALGPALHSVGEHNNAGLGPGCVAIERPLARSASPSHAIER
jgi:hypothetical protein